MRNHESWKIFETMIGNGIDTFKNTAPDVYQKVVRKSRIETITRKTDVNYVFWDSSFCSPRFNRFTTLKAKKNNLGVPKKGYLKKNLSSQNFNH